MSEFPPTPQLTPPVALNKTPVLKSGNLEKLSRGRFLSIVLGRRWTVRKVVLHKDFVVQYIDEEFGPNFVKGEFSIGGARISQSAFEGKSNVFEVKTSYGESIVFSCSSAGDLSEWIAAFKAAADNGWELYQNLNKLEKLIGVSPDSIKFNINEPAFLAHMTKDGYAVKRKNEILAAWVQALVDNFSRYIKDDHIFADLIRGKFRSLVIFAEPTEERIRSNYRTSFTPNGDLLVEYNQVWTNVSNLGSDLRTSISQGEPMSYLVAKSIRESQSILDTNLAAIGNILGITGVTLDYCVQDNTVQLLASNYDEKDFGSIIFGRYLSGLIKNLKEGVEKNGETFVQAFNFHFKTKKIIIKHAEDSSSWGRMYNKTTFSADGDLLIEYKSFCQNLEEIGRELKGLSI